jgi:DNA-binding NtrC family response regulator
VLLDIWMPDTDGVTLLKEWSTAGLLTMPVIMMSGHATIETAVEATRIGAFAFLEKPITHAEAAEGGGDGPAARERTPRRRGRGPASRPRLGPQAVPPSAHGATAC